jgi:hypothetical protein
MKSSRLLLSLLGLIVSFAPPAHAQEPTANVVRMSATTEYPDLSIAQQRRILDHLKASTWEKYVAAFYLPKSDPALAWMSEGMRDKLYGFNDAGSDANCYFTSLFALGALSLPERLLGVDEYLATLARGFRVLGNDDEYRSGDVLRLRRTRGGVDTHSVVYVGRIPDSATIVVLSKNGPEYGPYLLTSLQDLITRVYPGSAIAQGFRKK